MEAKGASIGRNCPLHRALESGRNAGSDGPRALKLGNGQQRGSNLGCNSGRSVEPRRHPAGLDALQRQRDLVFPGRSTVQVLTGQAGASGRSTHEIVVGYESLAEMEAWQETLRHRFVEEVVRGRWRQYEARESFLRPMGSFCRAQLRSRSLC